MTREWKHGDGLGRAEPETPIEAVDYTHQRYF
jgi:hypothetical protein